MLWIMMISSKWHQRVLGTQNIDTSLIYEDNRIGPSSRSHKSACLWNCKTVRFVLRVNIELLFVVHNWENGPLRDSIKQYGALTNFILFFACTNNSLNDEQNLYLSQIIALLPFVTLGGKSLFVVWSTISVQILQMLHTLILMPYIISS